MNYKTAYDSETKTKGLENWLFPTADSPEQCLAPKPEPAVEQPESHGDGVHDHLPFSTLFVLFFQKL